MKSFFKTIVVFLLILEARIILWKYKPKIVAVTGSVGKTTTKDALYAVLCTKFFVRKSEKSFNSEVGIPLTILGCPNGWSNPFIWITNLLEGFALIILKNHYPKWLVIEVGADRPGDIKTISKWLKPDIVVVTRLPNVPVHVEFFRSPEEVVAEKKYIVDALKSDGIAVFNHDDTKVMEFKKDVLGKVITFGFLEGADVRVSGEVTNMYRNKKPIGVRFRVGVDGKSIPIQMRGVLGRQHVYPALAALALGISQDINIVKIGESLKKLESSPGRMRLLDGIKGSHIIDDSYNSSPVAVTEALHTLNELEVEGKKIAVLGDMTELGEYTVEEHKKIGKQAVGVCDILITVGIRARYIAEGALAGGMSEKKILQYEDSRRAGKELESILEEGDVVLIKGSQLIRTERTVGEIMLHPSQKAQLLVRQERAWKRR